MRTKQEHLPDGEYWATCREKDEMQAIMNGHNAVFPQSKMTVKNGIAHFFRKGIEVWDCNSVYAKTHFIIQQA